MIYFLRHTMTISTNYIRRLSLSTGVPSGTCWRLENRVFQSILEEIHGRPYEMRVQKLLVPTTPMYVTWGLSIWHESNPLKKWNTWELGTAFLLAGTVYSDIPFAGVDKIRNKNRRLGLGLMGLHEWLLKHGKKYGPDEELGKYLEIYAK